MKILLIKPPHNPHMLSTTKGEPLELEYLASSVKDHEVRIFDMRIDKKLIRKLQEFKPHVVGVSSYTCDFNAARIILKEVKKFNPSIKTVIGGHHPTFEPFDFAEPFVDVIFLRLADQTFKEYINAINNNQDLLHIKNIAIVENDDLIFTEQEYTSPNLDSLPFPARHLTTKYRKKYRDAMKNRTALVLTSRGCPFRCTFCACWKMMDGKYTTRNPESIVEELSSLPEETDLVCFADDNTLHSIQRAWKLSELIKERRINKKFTMYARADTITKHPDLIESLRDSGLEYITMGIESFRDNELNTLNKRCSVNTNNEAIKILKKLGVSVSAHLIVHPEYSKSDFEELFKYVCKMYLFRVAYTVLTPLPGTELYLQNNHRFAIKDCDYFDFTHSIFPTKLNRKEFYRQYAELYRKSYSFLRYFKSKLNELKTLSGKSDYIPRFGTDKISLFRLTLLNTFGIPWYIKLRNSYKSEPLV